jgi:hypothetical protein
MKPDRELKDIAREWAEGRILFSTQVPKEILSMVFMPILFLTDEQREKLIADDVFAFYGKMADAGPRAINGFPMFTAMTSMTKPEYEKVAEHVKVYQAMQKQFEGSEA